MPPPLEALFTYASELPPAYTKETYRQNRKNSQISEAAQEEIERLLTEEGRRCFEEYLHAKHCLQQLELEAIFCAGISIGLELSHL